MVCFLVEAKTYHELFVFVSCLFRSRVVPGVSLSLFLFRSRPHALLVYNAISDVLIKIKYSFAIQRKNSTNFLFSLLFLLCIGLKKSSNIQIDA